MVEGDSFLLSVRTVGIMLPLSEVKRTGARPSFRPGDTLLIYAHAKYREPGSMTTYKKTWLLSVLVDLVLWPAAAQGQSAELRNASNRAGELYAQGRYQEALPYHEEALRMGEQEFGLDHPTTATLLNNLADL